ESKLSPSDNNNFKNLINNINQSIISPKSILTPSAPRETKNSPPILKTKPANEIFQNISNNTLTRPKNFYSSDIKPNSNNKFITNEHQIPSDQGKWDNTPKLSDFIHNKSVSTLDLLKLVAELAGNNKSRKLDSNTRRFSGSNHEDVDDWLFNL
ncbi:unnamed protein product, partial [Brachionus calyciflorus]